MKRKRKKTRRKPDLKSPYSTTWRNKCDLKWAKIIRRLGVCAINNGDCTSGPLNAHHLIDRDVKETRHNLQNGICLCVTHHKYNRRLSPHRGVPGFCHWMDINRPEQWLWAKLHRQDRTEAEDGKVVKINYKERFEFLEEVEKRLNEGVMK